VGQALGRLRGRLRRLARPRSAQANGLELRPAENGNVALTAEVDVQASDGAFVLALGFGITPAEAGQRALSSLQDGFDTAYAAYVQAWQAWQSSLPPVKQPPASRTVPYQHGRPAHPRGQEFPRRAHRQPVHAVGLRQGRRRPGGYHLVWPGPGRDGRRLLAAGAGEDVLRVLGYLQVTQEADGHWPQNMWLDGTPYWSGIQMDETALPSCSSTWSAAKQL